MAGSHSYDGRRAQLRRSVCTIGVSTDGHGRAALAVSPGLTHAAGPSVHPRVRPRPAARETVMLARRAERARVVRAFVFWVPGPGTGAGRWRHCSWTSSSSAVSRHGGSRAPGQTATVAVKTADDVIRVEVTDLGGPRVPKPRPAGSDAGDGRGSCSLPALPRDRGWRRRGGRMVTWFETAGQTSRPRCPRDVPARYPAARSGGNRRP